MGKRKNKLVFNKMVKLMGTEDVDAGELRQCAMLLRKFGYKPLKPLSDMHTAFRIIKHLIFEFTIWKQKIYKKKYTGRRLGTADRLYCFFLGN